MKKTLKRSGIILLLAANRIAKAMDENTLL